MRSQACVRAHSAATRLRNGVRRIRGLQMRARTQALYTPALRLNSSVLTRGADVHKCVQRKHRAAPPPHMLCLSFHLPLPCLPSLSLLLPLSLSPSPRLSPQFFAPSGCVKCCSVGVVAKLQPNLNRSRIAHNHTLNK